MADFGIGETLFTLIDALETAGPYAAGAAAATGTAAATGAFAGGTSAAGGTTAATGGAPSATGSTTSAAPGGTSPASPATTSPGFFGNILKYAGPPVAGAVASTGLQAAMGARRGPTIPPPPGAAMIDPAGAQAAALIRARQAIAGGLQSTISPGAGSQPAYTGATSGGKTLLGQ